VQGCTASNNSGDGFSFVGACLITGNNASNNGLNGFHVNGTGTTALNRIDGNLAVANGAAGILWANDFVARNVSFNNTPNYSPGVGANNTGPVQSAGSATNPFANF
jgi:parallel beta-helix repeat protein